MVNRKGIIIYFQNKKIVKEVEKAGVHISYVNPKANYLAGYIDEGQFDRVKKQLQKHRQIRKIEESMIEMEHLSFKE